MMRAVQEGSGQRGDHERIPVVVFIPGFALGGSERQATTLAAALDPRRFRVVPVSFQREGPLLDALPPALRQRLRVFRLRSFRHPSTVLQAVRFIRLLRQEQVRVVQCFDFYSNLFAVPLARLAGVPVVLAARRDVADVRTRTQTRVERAIFRMATGVVVNARAIRDKLVAEGSASARIWPILNGIDLSRFGGNRKPAAAGVPLRIGVLANLRPEKGHGILLKAVAALQRDPHVPPFEVLMAGQGSMRQKIQGSIDAAGIAGARLVGPVDASSFLAGLDVFVLPSLSNEGLSNAVMEAMASGLPVVTTGVGGADEVVEHGRTGSIVPAGDSEALAEALRVLLLDAALRLKQGEEGREAALHRFGVDRMAEEYADLYAELLGRGRAAGSAESHARNTVTMRE